MDDQEQPPILTLPQEVLDRIAKKLVVCVRPGGEMLEVTPEKLALFLKTILRPAHVNKSFSYTFRKAFFENHIFLFKQAVEYFPDEGKSMQKQIAALSRRSIVPLSWFLPRLRHLKTVILSSPFRDDPSQQSVHFLEALPIEMMKLIKHLKVTVNLEAGRAEATKSDCWFFLQGLDEYGLKNLKSLEVKVGALSSRVGGEEDVKQAVEEFKLKEKAQKVEVEFENDRQSWARW